MIKNYYINGDLRILGSKNIYGIWNKFLHSLYLKFEKKNKINKRTFKTIVFLIIMNTSVYSQNSIVQIDTLQCSEKINLHLDSIIKPKYSNTQISRMFGIVGGSTFVLVGCFASPRNELWINDNSTPGQFGYWKKEPWLKDKWIVLATGVLIGFTFSIK